MTIGANKVTQNIPVPFNLVAFERARENWKNQKIEILLGSGLAITGLALIPLIGAYAAIVCGAGLAILSHGLFADPTSSPPLIQSKATRVRIDAALKKSLQMSLKEIPAPAKRAMVGAGVLGSAAAFLAMNELWKSASATPNPKPSTHPKPKIPTQPNPKIPPPRNPTPNPAPISQTFTISIGETKPISHNVSEEPVSPILTPAEVKTPLPSDPAKGPELGSVLVSNPGDLTSPPPAPSTKPQRLSFFTVAETLGFFTASSTPDEILLSYLRSQPEDKICIFPSGFGPRPSLKTLRISSNATKDPAESSPWESRPDQNILLFTASHETVAASPTGKELVLPSAARPTITVTETNVKDFLQHSQFLLESLHKFDSAATESVPALTSGATTTAPASLVSTPASSKKPDQPFTILTVAEALEFFTSPSTPNDAFVIYLLSQPVARRCVFPSSLVPNQSTGPLGLPAAKHSESLSALESAFSGFEMSDQKILFFTVSKKGIAAADPSGLGLVPLDSSPQATITVTEMSMKDFVSAQHSRLFFESLNEFYSGQLNRPGHSVPALTSSTPTTPPASVISAPSPATKPFSKQPSSLDKASITATETTVKELASPPHAQFSLPLNYPFISDPVRLKSGHANPPSELSSRLPNITNTYTFSASIDPPPAFTHGAQTDAQPSFANGKHFQFLPGSLNKFNANQFKDADLDAKMASELGLDSSDANSLPGSKQTPLLDPSAAPHQTEPPVDMFSYMSSLISSWFSSGIAQPEVPITHPIPPSLESDLPQPSFTISSEPFTSNTSPEPACDEPLEFRPALGPPNTTPTAAREPFANRRPSQFLLDARNKFKSDRREHALVNDLMDCVIGFNSNRCPEDANLSAAPKTTALEPTHAAAPLPESPEESMIPSWFSSRSALPEVPINLLPQPFCPANFTPLPIGMQRQLAIAPSTSAAGPTTAPIASPAALAPNLAPLAIGAILLLAAHGTKKSLEFCPLPNKEQTGPLDLNEVTALIQRKQEEPSLLGSLLSAGLTQAQGAAKTVGSYAYSAAGQTLAELRNQVAARQQSNWEKLKQELADYVHALQWTADTGVPWIAKEVVYPAGAYVYTQASWILPEILDRGAAILRAAGQWAAENRAYERLALPSPHEPSKSPAPQKILLATDAAPSSPVLEKQDSPIPIKIAQKTVQAQSNRESTSLPSTNRLWNPLKVDEKKTLEEIIAPPIATDSSPKKSSKEASEAAAAPQNQPKALGSRTGFEDSKRGDALFDAKLATLTQDPAPAEKSEESQEVLTKGDILLDSEVVIDTQLPAPTDAAATPTIQQNPLGSRTSFEDSKRGDALFDTKLVTLTQDPAPAEKSEESQEVLTKGDILLDSEVVIDTQLPAPTDAAATPTIQQNPLGSRTSFEDSKRGDALFDTKLVTLTQDPAPAEKSEESQEVLTKGDILLDSEVVKVTPEPAPTEKSSETAASQEDSTKGDSLPEPELVKVTPEPAPTGRSESRGNQNQGQSSRAGSRAKQKRDTEADNKMDTEMAATLGI